jgi:histidine triad (HIT) family protein
MEFSRTVALGLRKAVPCQRIGMTVIGLEVPHVHVHLIPLNSMSDATFTKKEEVSESQMIELARQIATKIE